MTLSVKCRAGIGATAVAHMSACGGDKTLRIWPARSGHSRRPRHGQAWFLGLRAPHGRWAAEGRIYRMNPAAWAVTTTFNSRACLHSRLCSEILRIRGCSFILACRSARSAWYINREKGARSHYMQARFPNS